MKALVCQENKRIFSPTPALFEDESGKAADNAESERQAQTAVRAKIKRDIMQEFEARLDRILEML